MSTDMLILAHSLAVARCRDYITATTTKHVFSPTQTWWIGNLRNNCTRYNHVMGMERFLCFGSIRSWAHWHFQGEFSGCLSFLKFQRVHV